jgi:predicted nuclease of predicted toxin-antitoxin system
VSVKFYFDVHVRRAVADGLRLRQVDVLTAREDGSDRFSDSDLLERATTLGRILFTQDDDLLREASERLGSGESFCGVIYAHQLNITIGECVDDLELIAKASGTHEWANSVIYLPLR